MARATTISGGLADVAALKELGYDKADADEKNKNTYDNAQSVLAGARKNAISYLAKLDGSNLKSLVAVMEAVSEHLKKANDAVNVLESGNFSNRIVNQAKDRANAVAEYLNGKASYQVINEGKLSEYTFNVNGKDIPLYYVRNADNEIRYFYGTKETGYTYLIMNSDGSFSMAERGLDGKAQPSGYTWNGLNVYAEGTTAFVTSLEGTDTVKPGYTYLTYNKYYDRYEEKDATVYNGELKATLEDGTKIYFDGSANVYYSINEDGTYTKYEYRMSINDYYNSAINMSAKALEEAYAMIAGCDGLDATFEADVKARIARENDRNQVVEDEEEEAPASKYATENIVAVTYEDGKGNPYKTFILNYNNYSVKVVYDGIEYNIAAYEFVEIKNVTK